MEKKENEYNVQKKKQNEYIQCTKKEKLKEHVRGVKTALVVKTFLNISRH